MDGYMKRIRINEICCSIPMVDGVECQCPYNDDPTCWCNTSNVNDLPEDQLDEILKKMEGIRHA